jgi:hypothetical protein
MSPSDEVELFSKLSTSNKFEAWVRQEMADCVKSLVLTEGPQMFRTQGKYAVLEKIEKLLAAGKKLS